MLRKLFPILIGLFTLALSAHSQTVINVPSDYSTIQIALNNAIEGDTVLVQPGTYYENIIWPATNNIKLISIGDSSNTIIDGSNLSSVISFISDNIINTTTIIKGFKVTNGGNVSQGAGIAISKSGPTISNCWITRNISQQDGGGMFFSYCTESKPILKNTIINDNEALSRGGGIYIDKCYGYDMNFIIDKVLISENKCGQQGAGICINTADSLVITNSFFINNKVNYNGGGICFLNGGATARISNTAFIRNNASSGLGGGIRIYHNIKIDIINSTFFNNEAKVGGGAIMAETEDSEVNVYKSNFHKNGYGYFNDNNLKIQIAEYNWWGSNNGPYHPTQNPNGLGDSTNLYVSVDPWLTEPDTIAPPLPIQNVFIESIWPDSVKLTWDTSPIGDLKGYNIYFDTDSNNYVYDSYANQEDVGLDTSYIVKNLEAGKEYYFTVTCYDNSGNESWYSEEIRVTPNPSPLIHVLLDTIVFDTTFMNETLESELIIVNTGTDTLQIDSVRFNISQFTGSIDSTTIAPKDSAIVSVVFQPTTFGDIDGTLTIYSNAVNSIEKTIKLIGNGDYPEKPEIYSIQDVLDDQGGQVRITFSRSKYDGLDNTYQIADYSVWRLENDDQWDAIGMFNAVQDSVYYYVAPTLCDSTVQGNCLSTFKISAHTNNPDIFYYSDTLSGYSVDNIAPEAPQGLKSAIVSNGVQLDWESNDEEDFQYYKICRSDQPITDLSYSEIVFFTTVDTTYLDTQVEVDNQYYYRLVAYDYAGNRSDLSNEVNLEFTGIENLQGMQKFNMEQNQPNPFANSTTIQYTIPNQSLVNISVYSLLGSKITTLVNEDKVSGSYSFEWSSVDITPGIYFYTFKAQDVVITRKLIILDEL